MPVNNFEVVKATVPITDVQDQATGKKVLSGVGLSDFISIGYKDLGGEEEDMIRVIKGTVVGDTITLDIKSEEVGPLLEQGALLYLIDTDNFWEIDMQGPVIWYVMGYDLGDHDDQVLFGTISQMGDATRIVMDPDADGYLYFTFD